MKSIRKQNLKATDKFARITIVDTLQPGKEIEVTDEYMIGDKTWGEIKDKASDPDNQDKQWFRELSSEDQRLVNLVVEKKASMADEKLKK